MIGWLLRFLGVHDDYRREPRPKITLPKKLLVTSWKEFHGKKGKP